MRLLLTAGLAATVLCPHPAEGRTYPTPPSLEGDVEATMLNWISANLADDEVIASIDVRWVDFTEDGAPDALVSFGSYDGADRFALFRNECGQMTFHQSISASGVDASDVRITDGILTFATEAPQPGDAQCCWAGTRQWNVKLIHTQEQADRAAVCGNEPRPLSVRLEQLRAFVARAPLPLSPDSGAIFSIYPRDTLLSWAPLQNAMSYIVEVQYLDPSNGKWLPEDAPAEIIDATTYSFAFVGAQPGRWRVQGVDRLGHRTTFSEWWTFEYTS